MITYVELANKLRRLELFLAEKERQGDTQIISQESTQAIAPIAEQLNDAIDTALSDAGVNVQQDFNTIRLTYSNARLGQRNRN